MEAEPTNLEESIMKTLCWFSVFDYPLSLFEVHKWLLEPNQSYSLEEVIDSLESSKWLSDKIKSKDGFYSLASKNIFDSVKKRQARFIDAARKYKKLKRAARFFAALPGVRAVAAANTLSWWHTTESSDIDLFVVTRPGHIWSSRFYMVLPFLLVGKRPTHDHNNEHEDIDPFCFTFFSTQNALQLEEIAIRGKDYYLAFWTKALVPIFDKDNSLEKVGKVNYWATRLLPHAKQSCVHHSMKNHKRSYLPLQTGVFESLFRFVQQKRLPNQLRDCANTDSDVIINDDMLKFHDNDRREEYREEYEKVLAAQM